MIERTFTETKAAVDDAGFVEAIAWQFNVPDRVGDVIRKGALKRRSQSLPMLFGHDQRDVVGVWESFDESAESLVVKGRLLIGKVQRADEVFELLKAGAVNGVSIGFTNTKALRRNGNRYIREADLLEISLVSVPAHPDARITSIKSAAAPSLAAKIHAAAAAIRKGN